MAELTIDLLLEDKRFKKALNDAAKEGKKAGKNLGDNLTNPVQQSFTRLRNQLLAFASLNAVKNLFVGSIQAANRQEDAINSLNSALKRSGEFSQALSDDLQDFAASLQKISIFGDEVILEQVAFAKALGLSTEQAKLTTQAAIELSAATGGAISFESAVRNIAKTFSGLKGELGETVASIRNLTAEQLRAGEAARVILRENLGAAADQAKTTRGAFVQLTNAFGDLSESLGFIVTQSESTGGALRGLTRLATVLSEKLNPGSISLDRQVRQIKGQLTEINNLIAQAEKRKTEGGIFSSFLGGLDDDFIKRQQTRAARLNEQLFALTQKQNQRDAELRKQKKDQIVQISEQERNAILQQLIGVGQTEEQILQANYDKQLEQLRMALEKRAILQGEFDARKAILDDQRRQQENDALANQTITFSNFFEQVNAGFQSVAKTSIVTGKTVANALVNGFGNAAGSAFAAFGRALVTGENALKAFGDALLQAFGNALIQQGTGFILQGIAQSIAGFGSGAPLIAAGAAMATFGGALTAVGGGGASNPGVSTGLGTVGVGTPSQDIRTDNLQDERLEPETRVSINIQGDVLDSEETGLRIAKILEEASLNNNVRVIGGLA